MTQPIPGFVPGIVTNNDDPQGAGRIKCLVPGLLEPETAYWIMPMAWPGAGGTTEGSQYPPPKVGSQVAIIFAYGQYSDPDSQAIYLTGYYGQEEGPSSVKSAPSPQAMHKRVCIWEDESFIIYVVNDTDNNDKRLVLQTQKGTKIEINAADGAGHKSETITIEGRTGIDVFSHGVINMEAAQIQIQGRVVSPVGGNI